MKTITLKSDEHFFERLTHLAKELHLSKSELIRRAVMEYEERIYKMRLKQQLKEASLRVREANKKINDEFDVAIVDGLDD